MALERQMKSCCRRQWRHFSDRDYRSAPPFRLFSSIMTFISRVERSDRRISGEIRVLIVEDNPFDAELLEYRLRETGLAFTSELVQTRESYIEAIGTFRPDIILSDYDLPGFSGTEALQIRKELCPQVPFILVTGAACRERAVEILRGGATAYIAKDNPARMAAAVQDALMCRSGD